MTPNDLQRVPKAPTGFHNRLVQTLDGLPERKEGISMKRKNLTRLLVAAAVVTVMAVTVIAGGRMMMISSHSYRGDDYQELPRRVVGGGEARRGTKASERVFQWLRL